MKKGTANPPTTPDPRHDVFAIWEHWGDITGLGFCDDGATPFTLFAIQAHLSFLAPSGSWINMAAITEAAFADQALLANQHRGTQA